MSVLVPESYFLLPNKYEIPKYFDGQAIHGSDMDVIDITGVVLASHAWAEMLATKSYSGGSWRILLLSPASPGSRVRASESTVWRGNRLEMEKQLHINVGKIYDLAATVNSSCEIRYYPDVPVSRYLRFGEHVLQSFYPSNSTGRFTPIAVLPSTSVLAGRADKEFAVLWSRSKTKIL